ncbi:MAG TPA: PQQ-binding-like beta-propeller repeat protein [Planctomycetota bacterium]|nr:PQQ-binding-like beta-propeller repeat protein [Planctomycetota bacterium]
MRPVLLGFLLLALAPAAPGLEALPEGSPARPAAPLLGAPEWKATPDRPCGWRGDWTGRFSGATPPLSWSRRVHGITSAIRYQAAKPAGDAGKDSKPLEYFTIKDWLIAGPFGVSDPAQGIEQDFLGGETQVAPADGQKAGTAAWKFLHADIETQSRHDHNEGTCGQSYVDFVFAFGKFSVEGPGVKVEGDFKNKVAYAHTYLFSPAEAKLQLQIPFDGTAAKYWLNGKPGALDPKNRGKSYDIALGAGWNRLLIKVSVDDGLGKHYSGRWLSKWMAAAYLTPVGPLAYETKNVVWMTKLTGRSMSQPIVVGDRIFLGSNFSDLMCLSKTDGRVLWIRTTTPWDGLSPADRAAVKGQIEPLVAQLAKHNDEAVAAINAAVSPQGLPSDKAAELDRKLKDKREAENAIHKAFEQIDRKKYPPYPGNEVASSNATPTSDGTRVYWVAGGGIKGPGAYGIACFDLDGKRLWTVHEVLGSLEHGNHGSPVLVDGKLVYAANSTLLALDAKTGAQAWRNTKMVDVGSGTSPIVARIGTEAVIVTLKKIVRASDGEEISESNLNIWGTLTPIVENGVLYNTSRFRGWEETEGIVAVKLPTGTGAKSQAAVLWDPSGKDLTMPLRGTNFEIASPLFYEGILYGIDMTGGMIAVDLTAKKGLWRRWLDGYNRYNRYVYGVAASPTFAGKHLYVIDDAGYTHLIQPGAQYKEVGKNVLENIHFSGAGGNPCHQESFYTAPWFDGKAMYLRGEEYLYKIEEPGKKS